MAFDEDVPQMQLGWFHWTLAIVLLAFLGLVIWKQLERLDVKMARTSCLTRQKVVTDCVALWENDHGRFPQKTRGYACFTQRTGRVLKQEGFPKEFQGDALAKFARVPVWCCPERLRTTYQGNVDRVPDDGSPDGLGNYCFVQDDLKDGAAPLKDFVWSIPPLRLAICAVYGGRQQLGPDGRAGSRHSDRW